MYTNILYETQGPIATLTVNRPQKRNAVNNATAEEIDQALTQVENNPDLRVLILTGAGDKAFVAGADIGELDKRDTIRGRKESRRRQEIYTRIELLEIPSIAAINGYAFGVGCEIALACIFRLASEKAKMGQLEINLGIIPGAGGTQRLPRLIGKAHAAELILTGKIIKAEEAYRIGLVNQVVSPDKLMDDQALIVKTEQGLAIILGCAHRGMINTLYHAQQLTGTDTIHTVIGGAHLINASEERLWQTIAALKDIGVQRLGLCHCTDLPAAGVLAQEFGEKFFFNKAGTVTEFV